MKAKPIPTSPQNHPFRKDSQIFEHPKQRVGHYLFLAIVLSLIFGFLAGLVAIISSDYLTDKIPFLKNIFLQTEPFSGQVIVRNTDSFITERGKAITNLQNNYSRSLVGIYVKKVNTDSDDFYTSADLIAEGLVLTKDGYIVVPADVIKNKDNYVVISQDKSIYDITGHWLDPVQDIELIKISADSFPSITFASDSSLAIGQEIFQLSASGAVYLNSIADKNFQPVYQESEKLEKRYLLNDFRAGEWAFNYQGELVGFQNDLETAQLIPAEYISQALTHQLSAGAIVRNSLGASYVMLSEISGIPASAIGDLNNGALLTKDLDQTDLIAGDVITKVNDLELNLANPLNEALQNFQANQEIILTYWHKAIEKRLNITLSELK